MGAKQSKRSVDIAGKEAEAAGEVAGAGAAGEGRVEALAEPDALKPQLNGDAHIHEETDKEKQLDSGTPENEKDATTEKQNKEGDDSVKDKESAPVTNGDAEPKTENGESPATDDAKKPKKEKVKKKWSLRSISFSRKDKPKQEKKQKEEEPKTNGETEKVPEEAGEVTPENAVNEIAEEAKPETVKEEKTPETPVTEPLTNGSSTPESPKVESPTEETVSAESVPQSAPQPEQLPVNGLSLEEPKPETPEAPKEESKVEEKQPTAETTETAPAPEIPVKKEVCVEQMPLESPPPPLPANPPPSSVASFAATTMAPELTDASLPNTAELVLSAPHTNTESSTNKPDTDTPEPSNVVINDDCSNTAAPTTELPVLKDAVEQLEESAKSSIVVEQDESQSEVANVKSENIGESEITVDPSIEKIEIEKNTTDLSVTSEIVEQQPAPVIQNNESNVTADQSQEESLTNNENIQPVEAITDVIEKIEVSPVGEVPDLKLVENINGIATETTNEMVASEQEISVIGDNTPPSMETPPPPESDKAEDISESAVDALDNIEDLPPPPPLDDEVQVKAEETLESEASKVQIDVETVVPANRPPAINGIHDALHNGDSAHHADTDGDADVDNKLTHMTKDTDAAGQLATSAAAALAAPTEPQEPIPVSDKLADLIPEIPVVPDLNTETATDTTTEVAVSN